MILSTTVHAEFVRRRDRIPTHGLGLSVDVYSPDLHSLRGVLHERQVHPGYLEVFRATSTALAAVRKEVGGGLLSYHGEGLWLTQPEAIHDQVFNEDLREVAGHLGILQSAWLNHECATKHIAGYSFGTYLPPLYTQSSARVVAANASFVQGVLDRHGRLANGESPLLLLEMPPLTYFVAGTLSIPTFFRLVTEGTSCGLVLDIGHLWTVYRYSGMWKTLSLRRFVQEFLDAFPLERVVEIHVAGLAVHESNRIPSATSGAETAPDRVPLWTDAHAAPIPPVLFEMLDQVVSHPSLVSLKGLALEVDTKPIELIADEFERFSERYRSVFSRPRTDDNLVIAQAAPKESSASAEIKQELGHEYERYALVVAGRMNPHGPEWAGDWTCLDDLETYRAVYLPYEIIHWGGELEAMFPKTCRQLSERAVRLSAFVTFWFREPRPLAHAYDFFLLKIERFIEFVHDSAPELDVIAEAEAEELRQAYSRANEPAVTASERP